MKKILLLLSVFLALNTSVFSANETQYPLNAIGADVVVSLPAKFNMTGWAGVVIYDDETGFKLSDETKNVNVVWAENPGNEALRSTVSYNYSYNDNETNKTGSASIEVWVPGIGNNTSGSLDLSTVGDLNEPNHIVSILATDADADITITKITLNNFDYGYDDNGWVSVPLDYELESIEIAGIQITKLPVVQNGAKFYSATFTMGDLTDISDIAFSVDFSNATISNSKYLRIDLESDMTNAWGFGFATDQGSGNTRPFETNPLFKAQIGNSYYFTVPSGSTTVSECIVYKGWGNQDISDWVLNVKGIYLTDEDIDISNVNIKIPIAGSNDPNKQTGYDFPAYSGEFTIGDRLNGNDPAYSSAVNIPDASKTWYVRIDLEEDMTNVWNIFMDTDKGGVNGNPFVSTDWFKTQIGSSYYFSLPSGSERLNAVNIWKGSSDDADWTIKIKGMYLTDVIEDGVANIKIPIRGSNDPNTTLIFPVYSGDFVIPAENNSGDQGFYTFGVNVPDPTKTWYLQVDTKETIESEWGFAIDCNNAEDVSVGNHTKPYIDHPFYQKKINDSYYFVFPAGTAKIANIFVYTLGAQDIDYTIKIAGLYLTNAIESDELTWNGSTDNNWMNPKNWKDTNNDEAIPSSTANVTISKDADNYPILTTPTTINSITIEAGAEIVNQHLLNHTKAFVEYGLDTKRWYTITNPFAQDLTIEDDFFFNGTPDVFLKKFESAKWREVTDKTEKLPSGVGFIYGVDGEADATVTVTVPRNDADIRTLIGGNPVNSTVTFATGTGVYSSSKFVILSNPFMTAIDYGKLTTENNDELTGNYLIADGVSGNLIGYTGAGSWGFVPTGSTTSIGYGPIAPLQAVIAEGKETGEKSVTFDISKIATTPGSGELRNAVNPVNKLDIVASNGTSAVRTFIANRENENDAAKLFAKINGSVTFSTIPDVYTLKAPLEDGQFKALGANFIDTDETIIPLALATTYSGNITFTFSGMDSYDAAISFVDTEEEETLDLTGKESETYSFDYTGSTSASEDRFRLEFTPRKTTGINNDAATQSLLVYGKENTIHVLSSSSNPIKQVYVYNMHGQLLYADNNINALTYVSPSLTAAEIYVVKAITENGIKNVKIRVQ